MTYVLGERCKDGIVILSDSRMTDENEDVGQKIFCPIPNVVIGASGVTGLITKFMKQIKKYAKDHKVQSNEQIIEVIEDMVLKLDNRYYPRFYQSLELLVAIKDSENFSAELHYVTRRGVSEEIDENRSIGSGRPSGQIFLKATRREKRTMQESAIFGTFILHNIAGYGLNNTVDNTPQIWYIPFDGNIRQPEGEEVVDTILHNSYQMGINFSNFMRTLGKSQASVRDFKTS